MKLYFTCPKTGESFATENYSLQKGYRVLTDKHGERVLQGMLTLDSGCPICGVKHGYKVKDVGCPMSEERDEK